MTEASGEYELIKAEALPWQQPLIGQLVKLRKRGKLAHAILIDLSSAKSADSLGWRLVQSLLCPEPDEQGMPCDSCQHCNLMRANSHPDFTYATLVENERTHKLNRDIKIEQIRQLIYRLSLTPSLDAGKIAMVYPAERMNASAANSLLKTLEEPSDDATLVLVTHNPGRLPITIRSRCQRWRIEKPAPAMAGEWLQQRGLPAQMVKDYLALANNDAELALDLYADNMLEHMSAATTLIGSYLENRASLMDLVKDLRQMPLDILRIVVNHLLRSQIYRQLEAQLNEENKENFSKLLDLFNHSEFILRTDENNLILQLQLEDVLISLRQIQQQRISHASTG